MPKKDTSAAVIGMLSSAGDRTRPMLSTPVEPVAAPAVSAPPMPEPTASASVTVADPTAPEAIPSTEAPSATVSTLPSAPSAPAETEKAPRTLRLQPGTARALRDAWLEAKRDDVLLTAQDFASALVDEALARRRFLQTAAAR